jgi:hypothetical protein
MLILGFHLMNIALVFHITHRYTRSGALSGAAAITFGFSPLTASTIIWCINGVWGTSLLFVFLMSIDFEKFVRANKTSGFQAESCLPQTFRCSSVRPSEDERTTESDGNSTALPERHGFQGLKHYGYGLAWFTIALGFFTVALIGGAVIWLFMYVRLFWTKEMVRSWRHQVKIVLPFITIVAVYLSMRFYFNAQSRPYQDALTQFVVSKPAVPLTEGLSVLLNPPTGFYTTALQRLIPYCSEYYFIIVGVFALLLIKEFMLRRSQFHVVIMWLLFAVLTLAVPIVGRVFFLSKGVVFVETMLFPWYFCYPIAGISIILALLLRPSPLLERAIAGYSAITRFFAGAAVLALFGVLNYSNAVGIRATALDVREANLRFDQLVSRYRDSMTSFLHSASYSTEEEYYFQNMQADTGKAYPLNWMVFQHNIFQLYFPDTGNVKFFHVFWLPNEYYIWTPEAVIRKEK